MTFHEHIEVLLILNGLGQLAYELLPFCINGVTATGKEQLVVHAHIDAPVALFNGQTLALEPDERTAQPVLQGAHGSILRSQLVL
jgi:hypothetical protein